MSALLGSCAPGTGLDGPEWAAAPSGEGVCFSFNITDGFQDGAEVQQLFDCVNQYGAFDELAPLVGYLTTSDRVDALLDGLNGAFGELDVPGAIDVMVSLLRDPDRPAHGLLDIYTELYETKDTNRLMVQLLAVGQVASASMDRCELAATPQGCSLPRLGYRLLDTDLLDRLDVVLGALDHVPPGDPPSDLPPMLELVSSLIIATSAAENPEQGNVLLGLGDFLLDESVEGGAPLHQVLDVLVPAIDDDALVTGLTAELGRASEDGTLDLLASDVRILFTYDIHGDEVGFEGESVVDALLGILGDLDPALLDEQITLPGGSAPTTLLELALDTADDLYLQRADIAGIIAEVQDVTDLLCGAGASNDLCTLVNDLLPPVTAAIEQTEAVPRLILPLVHVLHNWADLDAILDLANDLLAWDLLGQTEPILRWTVENDLLAPVLDVVPVFLQPRLGRLSPAGEDALGALRLLLHPIDVEGVEVVPVDALLPLGRDLLGTPVEDARLDPLLVNVAHLLVDERSALSADALAELFEQVSESLPEHGIDLLALVRDVLENEPLWTGAIHLLADEQLITLLRPRLEGGDATWWVYDLTVRGVVDRMLEWVATLLGALIDVGLLDDPYPTPEAP